MLVDSKSKDNFNPLELALGRIQKIQIEGAEEIAADRKPFPPPPQTLKVGCFVSKIGEKRTVF